MFRFFAENHFFNHVLAVFAKQGKFVLASDLNAERTDILLKNRVKLFDAPKLLTLFGKVFDELFGKRINQTEFQIICLFSEGFFCVLIRRTRGDNTNLCAVVLNLVKFTAVCKFTKLSFSFFNHDMTLFRHSRHHNVLRNALFIRL